MHEKFRDMVKEKVSNVLAAKRDREQSAQTFRMSD